MKAFLFKYIDDSYYREKVNGIVRTVLLIGFIGFLIGGFVVKEYYGI